MGVVQIEKAKDSFRTERVTSTGRHIGSWQPGRKELGCQRQELRSISGDRPIGDISQHPKEGNQCGEGPAPLTRRLRERLRYTESCPRNSWGTWTSRRRRTN